MFPPSWQNFIAESNRIEGITREVLPTERDEFARFMDLKFVTVADLVQFVAVYQPNAMLRDRPGMNVIVGDHYPPLGGPDIRRYLVDLLELAQRDTDDRELHAYDIHRRYEELHPFTDGNGRSGRMLWAWMVREFPLGFLHAWYYQSLRFLRD